MKSVPDLSLGLQACYEYESFKKADGIEALVMGCPIPPLFRGIDFVAVVGSLSFAGFALLRQIRRYQNKNPGTFATFLRLAALFRPMQSKNRMFHGRSPALLRHDP